MFFKKFPKIAYSFDFSQNGTTSVVTNIFSRFKFNESVLNNAAAFYKYQYEDTDTPELVSYKEYGDVQYHWIISMVNLANDPLFEFPLPINTLEAKILKKYGYNSISTAQSTIIHYELEVKNVLTEVNGATIETIDKSIVSLSQFNYKTNSIETKLINTPVTETTQFYANNSDPNTAVVANLSVTSTYKPVYVYDYEIEQNENKRQIKILKKQYIEPLLTEIETVLND
jgi:hypothetical protein